MRAPTSALWTPRIALALTAGLFVAGCTKEPVDTGENIELPPEETTDIVIDSGFVVDTGDTGFADGDRDIEPEHSLTITHEGEWNLTPLGGPYSAFTGQMDVLEILDGNLKEPACELVWSLTGEEGNAKEKGECPSCQFTFSVQFYLSESLAGACRDPELPQDGEVWRLGYDAGEGVLTREYGGTGIWIPWFEADLSGDTLTFEWSTTVGVVVEEEDQ